jgi:hypothetical protein
MNRFPQRNPSKKYNKIPNVTKDVAAAFAVQFVLLVDKNNLHAIGWQFNTMLSRHTVICHGTIKKYFSKMSINHNKGKNVHYMNAAVYLSYPKVRDYDNAPLGELLIFLRNLIIEYGNANIVIELCRKINLAIESQNPRQDLLAIFDEITMRISHVEARIETNGKEIYSGVCITPYNYNTICEHYMSKRVCIPYLKELRHEDKVAIAEIYKDYPFMGIIPEQLIARTMKDSKDESEYSRRVQYAVFGRQKPPEMYLSYKIHLLLK